MAKWLFKKCFCERLWSHTKNIGNRHGLVSKFTFSLIGCEAEHSFLWKQGFAWGLGSLSCHPKTCDIPNSSVVITEHHHHGYVLCKTITWPQALGEGLLEGWVLGYRGHIGEKCSDSPVLGIVSEGRQQGFQLRKTVHSLGGRTHIREIGEITNDTTIKKGKESAV